jgi:5'-3' exonuclease
MIISENYKEHNQNEQDENLYIQEIDSIIELSTFDYNELYQQYEQVVQSTHIYQHNQITMFIDGSSLAYLHSVNENYKNSIIKHLIKLSRHYNTDKVIIFTEDSGSNFRKQLFPEYKAQRLEIKQKQLEQNKDYTPYLYDCKQFINKLKPFKCINVENDDMIRIMSNRYRVKNLEYVIIANDSDLLAIYGNHMNMKTNVEFVVDNDIIELKESIKIKDNKQVKTKKLYTTGLFSTYSKILKGATKENYKGLKGYGDVKVYDILSECKTEQDMQQVCIEHFKQIYPDTYKDELSVAFKLCYLIEYNNTFTEPRINNIKEILNAIE